MRIIEVIQSKVWKNKINGRTVSIYGAVPWTGQAEKEQWEMVIVGWTWRNDNGTVGLGRVPAKTREEAEAVMVKFNNNDWSK